MGRNLREARRRAGFSQRDLMKLGIIRQGNLSGIENGHKLPQLDTLLMLALLYGTSLSRILEGVEGERGETTGV